MLETETLSKSDLTSSTEEPTNSFESVLGSLGQFSRFQSLLYFSLWLPAASMAASVYASVYMEYSPDFHCAAVVRGGGEDYTAAVIFDKDLANFTCSLPVSTAAQSLSSASAPAAASTCVRWVYDTSVFTNTVVSQFNLVCERGHLKTVATTVYMSGMLVGSFFFGWFGDKFGRKWAFLATTLCISLGSAAAALSPNIWVYMVARFVTSCGGVGIFITAFVIALEFVGPKYRTVCGVAIEVPFALGELYIVLLAYLIRDWQIYQLAIGLPFFLFLVYMAKIPESVRWLRTQGRHEEARRVLVRVAQTNKVILPNYADTDEDCAEGLAGGDSVGLSTMFVEPTLRLHFVIMALNWIVATLGYYGLGLSSVSLSSDPFSSFAFSAAMELPAYLFCLLSLDRFGRKGILAFSQLLAGVTCVAAALLPPHLQLLKLGLTLTGKFGAAASFAIVYVFTAELFPTQIRNSAIGLCSTASRIGAIFTPTIASLSASNPLILYLVIGVSCALGGAAALWLPETAGQPLPDSVEEAVALNRRKTAGNSRRDGKLLVLNMQTGQQLLAKEKMVV